MPVTTDCEQRLVALLAEAGRGPKRDGLYALWLVVRAAEALFGPNHVSPKNHRRRLQAIELRLDARVRRAREVGHYAAAFASGER